MPPDVLAVRPYAPADAEALIALFKGAVRIVARRDYSEAQVMAWAPDDIERTLFAARCASRPTWVAETGGTVVGFTDLEPDGHLDMMFVHPGFQRQGVASALLRQVEDAAGAGHLRRLFTEASITARPFFERRGFRVIAPETVARRGQALLRFRMEKFLRAPGA
ncbi:MAG: GNAT family N-acetyltransferase [Alphaproteobacteria bacterium]|nr:GNAT family N-acetyltransferase [Alphaproteobacteria bacterium]